MALGERFTDILTAARAGAECAWATVYRDLAPSLLAFLRASGAPDPENLLGDAFLAVVRGVGRFEGGEGEFRAWVFAIARNRVIDDRRYRARRPVQPVPDQDLRRAGPAGDVEEEALAELAIGRVRSLLSKLAPAQRDVLLLRIIGGLNIDEVARAMGKTSGAVKALQARGLAAVRREISQEAVSP
jgi:RNA polymerase sigma-70 factor (ECF subfamily)